MFCKKFGQRRGYEEILFDILKLVGKEGAIKTEIMYGVKMSYSQEKKYLDFLMINKLLSLDKEGKDEVYKITEKGQKLFDLLSQIGAMFGW